MIIKNAEWQEIQNRISAIEKQNKQLYKDNERLIEMNQRYAAQKARRNLEESDNVKLRDRIATMRTLDFLETAISILSWDALPDSEYGFFYSKRIEKMISDFGAVCIFPDKYLDRPNWWVLPFTGDGGSINGYGEYSIITPYIPSGIAGAPEQLKGGAVFGRKIVNKDCVIVSDMYEYHQTNGNTSLFTLRGAIEIYARLIADCEVAKKINRNWLKIPFLFDSKGVKKQDFDAMMNDIKKIIVGTENNDEAIVTDYADNFNILPTNVAYHGRDLQEAIIDLENTVFEYLGIAHNQNEKMAQQTNAEVYKNADQYNIRIMRRIQNRQLAIHNAKKIWKNWGNVSIKCNLYDFKRSNITLEIMQNQARERKDNELSKSNVTAN